MEDAFESPASQELVYIDVGGKIFKMLCQTVMNYPDSLLAKLLRDCPDFGKQKQPVYIDRSPATFEWILEVYRSVSQNPSSCVPKPCFRNGDYEATMPCRSAEHLQRELDFYQLPSLDELGLSNSSSSDFLAQSAEMVSKKLAREIVEEIKKSGFEDMFPWCVYIYFKAPDEAAKPQRQILVLPDIVRASKWNPTYLNLIEVGKHRELIESMARGAIYRQDNEVYQFVGRSESPLILQPPTDAFIGTLCEEARSLGLSIEAKNLKSVRNNTLYYHIDSRSIPHLRCYPLRK